MNFGFLIRSDVPRKTPFPRSRIGARDTRATPRHRHHTYFTVYDDLGYFDAAPRYSVDTADAPGGFSSLPLDVISTHILKSDFLPEPGDLGRLRAVSRGMRDAVDATGREIKVVRDWHAANHGYLSLLKDRHTRGVLQIDRYLCEAAARSGQLEELKSFRAKNFPWTQRTCALAAEGGHLEILKWARENDCPWDENTCMFAAKGGHLEVLQWARANDCPWDENTCAFAAYYGHLEVLEGAPRE